MHKIKVNDASKLKKLTKKMFHLLKRVTQKALGTEFGSPCWHVRIVYDVKYVVYGH